MCGSSSARMQNPMDIYSFGIFVTPRHLKTPTSMESVGASKACKDNFNEDNSTQALRSQASKEPDKEPKKQCLLSGAQPEQNNNYKLRAKHHTVNIEDVELIIREPYILTGYRLPDQPWSYYVSSIGWLHNESMNVWTHLIGCVLLAVHAVVLGMRLDSFRDPRAGLMVAFTVSCFFSNLFSSLAHLLHTKSAKHHYVLYFLDYAGICVYNFGNGIDALYSCSTPEEYFAVKSFFLPVLVVGCYISYVAVLLARLKFQGPKHDRRRKVVMTVIYLVVMGFVAWPIASRYVRCIADTDCSIGSLNHITIIFVFFALDGISFTSLLPEKLWPGKFDMWGSSHQWFHVFVMATQQLQLYALHVDYVERGRARHVSTTTASILLAMGILMLMQVVTIRLMVPAINSKVEKGSGAVNSDPEQQEMEPQAAASADNVDEE